MTVKEGLSEKKAIGETGPEHKRDNPGQMPTKGKDGSATKGGKSFKIN